MNYNFIIIRKILKMIIIPELQKIFICVPKNASTSISKAILNKYPKAFLVARHLEACGVPDDFLHYQKYGIVREPVERLFSLYKFSKSYKKSNFFPSCYVEDMRKNYINDFSSFILNNNFIFNNPYDSNGIFHPRYKINHIMPETTKSQYIFLRPDLGTIIYKYSDFKELLDIFKIKDLENIYETEKIPLPELSLPAKEHIEEYFKWDLANFK